MQLIEILRHPDLGDDDDATIYVARPWPSDAEAILISPAPDQTHPIERNDRSFEYFLEAFIARDFLEDLIASGAAEGVSEQQRCERLIRYAETDA